MYKQVKDINSGEIHTVLLEPATFIPFDTANTDYQTFKKSVLAGAELQDADGVAMTHDDAVAFIKTLP